MRFQPSIAHLGAGGCDHIIWAPKEEHSCLALIEELRVAREEAVRLAEMISLLRSTLKRPRIGVLATEWKVAQDRIETLEAELKEFHAPARSGTNDFVGGTAGRAARLRCVASLQGIRDEQIMRHRLQVFSCANLAAQPVAGLVVRTTYVVNNTYAEDILGSSALISFYDGHAQPSFSERFNRLVHAFRAYRDGRSVETTAFLSGATFIEVPASAEDRTQLVEGIMKRDPLSEVNFVNIPVLEQQLRDVDSEVIERQFQSILKYTKPLASMKALG
jgi:hypothetical protein